MPYDALSARVSASSTRCIDFVAGAHPVHEIRHRRTARPAAAARIRSGCAVIAATHRRLEPRDDRLDAVALDGAHGPHADEIARALPTDCP